MCCAFIDQKTRLPSIYHARLLTMLNQILEVVDHQAYLGITITERLLIGKRTFEM